MLDRAQRRSSGRSRTSSGFTLVELLVVMGIIILLVSILIPIASRVRKTANETATSAQLARIAAAIQAYYTDFRSLPGPIAENDLDVSATPGTPTAIPGFGALQLSSGTAIKGVTSQNNLVLGLLGGTFLDFTANKWTYDPNAVGKGPASLNPSLSTQKQTNPYIDVPPNELSPRDSAGNFLAFGANDTYDGTHGLPTFMDHIPGNILGQPATNLSSFEYGPILYFRARVGNPGIVTVGPPAAGTAQYDFSVPANSSYFIPNPPAKPDPVSSSDFAVGTSGYPDSTTVYFANPGILNQPRGKDSFILISAGTDRMFGTRDDIIYSN